MADASEGWQVLLYGIYYSPVKECPPAKESPSHTLAQFSVKANSTKHPPVACEMACTYG